MPPMTYRPTLSVEMRATFFPAVLLLVFPLALTLRADEPTADAAAGQVAEILGRRCLRCHNDHDKKGGLSLATSTTMLRGGDSGPAIVRNSANESPIVLMVSGDDPQMPQEGEPLTPAEIKLLRDWIDAGAAWPAELVVAEPSVTDADWWSLRPLRQPRVPTMPPDSAYPAVNPIDAFIAASLHKRGLAPSPEADRRTLIRRLYFDLLGLPASYEEIQAFERDADPRAYEQLVDRLLASPHYGERWARHWLDVVHYGDTHGYDKDQPRPHAWPYRDYVIRSFNADKPFERFVREQLAGDVLWPESSDAIEATGFIAAGPWDLIGHAEVPEEKLDGQVARNLDRDDMVTSTMNTFLGLTVQCARCHNHKFDPVMQEHYYSLQAVFAALDRADREYDSDPTIAARRRELTARRNHFQVRQAELEQRIQQRSGESPPQSAAASDSPLAAALKTELQSVRQALEDAAKQLADLPPPRQVYAGTVHHGKGAFLGRGHLGGKPRDIFLLVRGDIRHRGPLVGPGTVPIIAGTDGRFALPADHHEGARRVALADWILRPDHPMSWRCIVNRIWQYHFGQGIVATPNDLGRMGQLPTHPELLDWLAVWFRDSGQSIKQLHRLIVTSRTYRQSSAARADFEQIDADNRYVWRMNRRAVEAEVMRDTVLAVSGKLDRAMFGPGFRDFVLEKPEHSPHYEYHKHDPDDRSSHRRSVYRFLVRSQQQPFMQTLDCADPSQSVARRDTTITAVQALTLLNNRFMVRMSEHFAARLRDDSSDVTRQIETAFRMALGRDPQSSEFTAMRAYTDQYGLENLCRVVFNLNEFAFVD